MVEPPTTPATKVDVAGIGKHPDIADDDIHAIWPRVAGKAASDLSFDEDFQLVIRRIQQGFEAIANDRIQVTRFVTINSGCMIHDAKMAATLGHISVE
ncbi:hypothetical protein [Acidisoma sp. S159]|uniref:hypothetical protein n=1 Tax=Acidisoma sp. S159 TaxID=1747225 RepID=UPI00131C0458|nr:hypothetical protein [Acidisoma sp. S159]